MHNAHYLINICITKHISIRLCSFVASAKCDFWYFQDVSFPCVVAILYVLVFDHCDCTPTNDGILKLATACHLPEFLFIYRHCDHYDQVPAAISRAWRYRCDLQIGPTRTVITLDI